MCDIHFIGIKHPPAENSFDFLGKIEVFEVSIFPCGECTGHLQYLSPEIDVYGPYMKLVNDKVKGRPRGLD